VKSFLLPIFNGIALRHTHLKLGLQQRFFFSDLGGIFAGAKMELLIYVSLEVELHAPYFT